MKFTVKKESLLPLLTRINSIVEKNSPQKVRTHILLDASDSGLKLIGFGNEIKISGLIDAKIAESGSTTVTCDKFFDIIRLLPNTSDIQITQAENQLDIISGKSQFHLATIPAEDYPVPESFAFEQSFSLSANQLVELLNRVKFSMANNDVRHYLNGLLLHFTPSSLFAVTTDGHRLSVAETANTFGIEEQKVILPQKTVGEITNWLANQKNNLQINLSNTHIQFAYDQVEMTSTVINAEFPAYETVIPEMASNLVIIPKEAFSQALKRTSILSSEYGLGVSLTFAPWKLNLTAKNMDNESAEDSIDINYDGDDIKTAFNIKYLQDILSVIESENVTLSLQDGQSSCLIFDTDKEDNRYIVMPMNI